MAFGDPVARFTMRADNKTGAAFSSVNRSMKKSSALAGKLGGTFAAYFGGRQLLRMGGDAIQFGSALTDVATGLSIGVEELQALQFAAQDAGASQEHLARALRNVKDRVQGAADGNKSYATALDRLGVSTSQLLALPLEQRLEAIARGYANATDKNAAFSAVMDILGERAGPKLIEVLNRLNTEGFKGLEESARAAGRVMDKEVAQKLDDAADKLAAFEKRMTIITGNIVGSKVGVATIDALDNAASGGGAAFGKAFKERIQKNTLANLFAPQVVAGLAIRDGLAAASTFGANKNTMQVTERTRKMQADLASVGGDKEAYHELVRQRKAAELQNKQLEQLLDKLPTPIFN